MIMTLIRRLELFVYSIYVSKLQISSSTDLVSIKFHTYINSGIK